MKKVHTINGLVVIERYEKGITIIETLSTLEYIAALMQEVDSQQEILDHQQWWEQVKQNVIQLWKSQSLIIRMK